MSVPHNEYKIVRIYYIDRTLFISDRHKDYEYIFIRLKDLFLSFSESFHCSFAAKVRCLVLEVVKHF